MSTYTADGRYDVDFSQYSFNQSVGTFIYKLRRKQHSKSGSLMLFLDGDDGIRHMAPVFRDRNYLGMESVNPGTKLEITYVKSCTGTVYVRSIAVLAAQ